MKRLARALVLIVSLYFLGCFGIYLFQEKLIFHPYPLEESESLAFHMEFEELEVPVEEGIWLNAALFKQDQHSKGLVLFFHGNTGNILRYEGHVKEFASRGWDVLTVDYRSFGKSDGELSQDHLLSDGLATFDFCTKELGYSDIVIYGQSLGTGVTTYIASERAVKGIILEAPYYSMSRIGEELFPYVPISILLNYPLPSFEYLKKSDCRVLAFHGTEDRTIPFEAHGQALQAIHPSMHLVSLAGGTHNNCRTFPIYAQEMDLFLNKMATR